MAQVEFLKHRQRLFVLAILAVVLIAVLGFRCENPHPPGYLIDANAGGIARMAKGFPWPLLLGTLGSLLIVFGTLSEERSEGTRPAWRRAYVVLGLLALLGIASWTENLALFQGLRVLGVAGTGLVMIVTGICGSLLRIARFVRLIFTKGIPAPAGSSGHSRTSPLMSPAGLLLVITAIALLLGLEATDGVWPVKDEYPAPLCQLCETYETDWARNSPCGPAPAECLTGGPAEYIVAIVFPLLPLIFYWVRLACNYYLIRNNRGDATGIAKELWRGYSVAGLFLVLISPMMAQRMWWIDEHGIAIFSAIVSYYFPMIAGAFAASRKRT